MNPYFQNQINSQMNPQFMALLRQLMAPGGFGATTMPTPDVIGDFGPGGNVAPDPGNLGGYGAAPMQQNPSTSITGGIGSLMGMSAPRGMSGMNANRSNQAWSSFMPNNPAQTISNFARQGY